MKQMLAGHTTWLSIFAALSCAGPSLAAEEAPGWADRIVVHGDLRLRYDMVREDLSEDRDRARFRGRFGITGDISPDVKAVFALATGGDDPVSANENFGDGFTTKDIGIDLAYVEWQFGGDWTFTGGKMPKPWFRAGDTTLVWDGDLNPEGLVVSYGGKKLFGSAGTFVVEERSSDAESRLNTLQAGVKLPVADDSQLTMALALFDYTNTIGNEPFYDGNPQGNTVDAAGNYVFAYSEVELGAEYKTQVGNWPLTFFGDYVVNTEVDREDTAYTVGIAVGAAKAPGSMQFNYAWHDTGADALIATYNDSDLADGITDATGHYFRARYVLREKIVLTGSFIFSEYGDFTGNPRDFDHFMFDIQFNF